MRLVTLEARDNFAWIRIERDAKRNALNTQARDELREILEQTANEFSVLAITGQGKSFCAGVDLKEINEHAARGSSAPLEDWRALNLSIRKHPAIFIAAVNGLALGGGATLIGLCDLAIAASDVEIGLPEIGFGMYANPAGPAVQLNLSRKRAAWLLLTANRISGTTAAEWGLVNEAVDAEALEARVSALAKQISRFDKTALAETKQALDKIPLDIASWESAFEFGVGVNQRISQLSDVTATGLENFSAGGRNPGQG